MPKDNLINESRASVFGNQIRQHNCMKLANARMLNRYNGVLKSDTYLNLSEAEKNKWWKVEFNEMKKLNEEYQVKIKQDERVKYEQKREAKIRQTNKLANLSSQAALYGGPLSSERINEGFFEKLLENETEYVKYVLALECSILRIQHPTEATLFRTKQLDKTIRKYVAIEPAVIIQNLKEYFSSVPITEAAANEKLLSYFENSSEMEN